MTQCVGNCCGSSRMFVTVVAHIAMLQAPSNTRNLAPTAMLQAPGTIFAVVPTRCCAPGFMHYFYLHYLPITRLQAPSTYFWLHYLSITMLQAPYTIFSSRTYSLLCYRLNFNCITYPLLCYRLHVLLLSAVPRHPLLCYRLHVLLESTLSYVKGSKYYVCL